jgi:hypothetical protein
MLWISGLGLFEAVRLKCKDAPSLRRTLTGHGALYIKRTLNVARFGEYRELHPQIISCFASDVATRPLGHKRGNLFSYLLPNC